MFACRQYGFPFKVYLAENDLTSWYPQNKMYLFHGIADERVPHQNSVVAYKTLGGTNNPNLYFETLDESYGGHQDAAPWCLITAFNISEEAKIILQRGDINQDLVLNIVDIIYIIDIILSTVVYDGILFWSSDLNNDDLINIFDVIMLIEEILYNE